MRDSRRMLYVKVWDDDINKYCVGRFNYELEDCYEVLMEHGIIKTFKNLIVIPNEVSLNSTKQLDELCIS